MNEYLDEYSVSNLCTEELEAKKAARQLRKAFLLMTGGNGVYY